MTIGETLQLLRTRKGVSLSRVAGLSELSKCQVHNAEHDKGITVRTLRAIVEGGLEMSMLEFWRVLEGPKASSRSRRAA